MLGRFLGVSRFLGERRLAEGHWLYAVFWFRRVAAPRHAPFFFSGPPLWARPSYQAGRWTQVDARLQQSSVSSSPVFVSFLGVRIGSFPGLHRALFVSVTDSLLHWQGLGVSLSLEQRCSSSSGWLDHPFFPTSDAVTVSGPPHPPGRRSPDPRCTPAPAHTVRRPATSPHRPHLAALERLTHPRHTGAGGRCTSRLARARDASTGT